MKNKQLIAVCDASENYALNLSGSLMQLVPEYMSVSTFTSVEALAKYSTENEINTIIVSESSYDPCVMQATFGVLIVLRENPEFVLEGAILIDRFQSREDLLMSVLKNLPESMEGCFVKRLKTRSWKVIGLYSPVRRCLQTSFGLSMGQLLAQEHKVLYMNFECFSGFSRWFEKQFDSDVLDLLYFFDCDKEKLARRIPMMVHRLGDLEIIPPAASYYETSDRGGEHWVEVFRAIEDVTDYEYLILDLTDSMQGLLQVLEYCDRVYTLVREDTLSLAKLEQYEHWMVQHSWAEIMSKTLKFNLPSFDDLPARPDMLPRSELAGYVRAIINEDTLERKVINE